MEELIRYVAESLAEHPDKIRIEQSEEEGSTVYSLLLDQEDLGRLIGRHGRTAEALRTLISAAGQKQGLRATLRIRELD